jgi:hypothetical protein
VIFLLLSLNTVSAEGVILSKTNVDDEIIEGESASFDLIVRNDDRKERDIFVAFPYSSNWRVNINPYLMRIPSKSERTARVEIFSLNDNNLGTFDIVLNVRSRDEEIKKDYVFRVKAVPYIGVEIVSELIVPEKIDPRVGGNIKLKLDNVRNNDFDELEIIIKSDDLFSERRFLELKSGEVKLENFKVSLPENLAPGKYEVDVKINYGNKNLITDQKSFTIEGFSDVIAKKSNEDRLLKSKVVLSKSNVGTEEKNERITYSVSGFRRLFTSFSKEPDSFEKIDGVYVAQWNLILNPGDNFDVEIVSNYTNIFWVGLGVFLFVLFVLQMKKKRIIVSKRVLTVDKNKEGISGMKVLLTIKNRGRRPLSDIRLSDSLPMFVGTAPHSFGTLHPTKVKKTALGNTRLVWHIGEIHGGEERIISYVAKSRLSIIGKLILPSAVVSYKRGSRVIKSKSNKLTLLTTLQEEMR